MYRTIRQRLRKVVLLLAVVGAAMVFTPARPAAAQQITVLLNGRPVYFGGVPPIEVGGRVLVPLRGVFEALNATVDYDAAARTVLANRGETQVQLTIGSRQASVNGQVQMLDVPAQARLGRTLVPLRFISEALGAQVRWSGAQRTVYITPPPDAP